MSVLQKEPAITASAVTAVVGAVIGVLVAFHVGISEDQKTSVLTAVGLIWPFVTLGVGWFIRQRVTPVAKN